MIPLFSLHLAVVLLEIVAAQEHREIVRPRVISFGETASFYVLISNWTVKMKKSESIIPSPEIAACEFYRGENATSALTICQGDVYGSLYVDGTAFLLEPLKNGWHSLKQLKRARSKRDGASLIYNLTGDSMEISGEKPEAVEFMSADYQNVGYFFDETWKTETFAQKTHPRWLELAVAADYTVIDFHGARVHEYILALLNIVATIFHDLFLDSNLKIVISRVILYPDDKDGMVHPGNARQSLENVNKWNRKLLSSSNLSHDVALWLTKLDIGGPSGYAPVSGACDPARSCALNRDEGLTSAFIIAHEIAHILGLTHDGDNKAGNNCQDEAFRGSVMAPMVAAHFHDFQWSSCSKKEFTQRIRQWSCFLNRPSDTEQRDIEKPIRETFTMNDQCRMEFGEGYEVCKTFEVPNSCFQLWCGQTNVSKVCKTKKGPALEGTICDEGKWCVNGSCDSIDYSKASLARIPSFNKNSYWSEWSLWGKCSVSCGIGVQFRTRKCIKSSYVYSKNRCQGESENFRVCEQEKCLELRDIRSEECSRLTKFEENATWVPFESEKIRWKCRLTCRNKKSDDVIFTSSNVVDGTPCSYGETDICVKGRCYEMGCDKVLGSRKKLDTCGVCDGDDSSCDNVSNKFQRKLRRVHTSSQFFMNTPRRVNRLAFIPRGAHNIRIDISINAPPSSKDNVITIKNRNKQRNDIRDFDTQGQTRVLVVEGAAFHPQKLPGLYTIWARGPLLGDVIVSLIVPNALIRHGTLVSTFSRFVVNRNERLSRNKYVWLIGGWSPCSLACGGGKRHKTVACKDEETGNLVSRTKCSTVPKPGLVAEKCNTFSCGFKWVTGAWGNCSASCGNFGLQKRPLYCVRSVSKLEGNADSPENCALRKRPANEQFCNRIPCLNQWKSLIKT